MKKNNRPLLAAALLMGLFSLLGAVTAHAQEENPLVATTGPNVLGQGHIQWNSNLEYLHYEINFSHDPTIRVDRFGLGNGLRFGIGNRAELTVDLDCEYGMNNSNRYRNGFGLTPSVGAKLLLSDGHGWFPQTAFFTHIAAPIPLYNNAPWYTYVRPEIGFQFRNRLGQRWLLDYSLGFSWDGFSGDPLATSFDFLSDYVRYSLFARWLATDRLLLGVGVGNTNLVYQRSADFELRYQANPNLQLTVQASSKLGMSDVGTSNQVHALAGISWTIR